PGSGQDPSGAPGTGSPEAERDSNGPFGAGSRGDGPDGDGPAGGQPGEGPGESHGLGPLAPALCRQLAIAAIGSPWTRLCVTVTDAHGIAIGHGCAKAPRNAKAKPPG